MPRGCYKRGVTSAYEFIMAHIDVDGNGCWLWTGATRPSGYGTVNKHRWGYWSAHRLSYATLVGLIPEGMEIDHVCRVRKCVNPAHLEPVTKKENCYRGTSFAAENAKKTCCPKGHPFTEENTYTYGGKRRDCRACGRERVRKYLQNKRAA